MPARAASHWTELNIGPFYVDTDSDTAAARDVLTELEQTRWVLGGLLESKDLPSVWPVRILLTRAKGADARHYTGISLPGSSRGAPDPAPVLRDLGPESEKTNPTGHFVWQNAQYLMVTTPGNHVPLDELAGILLDANTPRLPPEVESGMRQLFSTLQAHGSRVTWGGAPTHPDLDWARMQLFATKFEYGASFHIFLHAVQGSGVQAAEQNAFGKPYKQLEQEAQANLASHNWQPVSVSGRPLDPKRDLGEHTLDPAIAAVYLADAEFASDPNSAEAAYKAAIEAKGPAAALGFEGLSHIAENGHDNPKPFLDNAIHAGSKSAPVYVTAAEGLDAAQALPLLKKAAQLNPLWAEPIFKQAELAPNPAEKEKLLKEAVKLDPRGTQYWLELAQLQTETGESTAAQGTWLRAEDSAPDPKERDRIHQLRIDSEQARLDAADEARRREREAAHLDDEHAQKAELDRIHAAEEKANQSVDAKAGTAKPEDAVPWDQVVAQKKLQGMLVRVDCLHTATRLWVKDKTGTATQLLLKQVTPPGLTCGPQQPARRVTLAYSADPDEQFHTAGTVVSIQVQ